MHDPLFMNSRKVLKFLIFILVIWACNSPESYLIISLISKSNSLWKSTINFMNNDGTLKSNLTFNFMRLVFKRGFNSRNVFQFWFLRPLFKSGPFSRASIIGAGMVSYHYPLGSWSSGSKQIWILQMRLYGAL